MNFSRWKAFVLDTKATFPAFNELDGKLKSCGHFSLVFLTSLDLTIAIAIDVKHITQKRLFKLK